MLEPFFTLLQNLPFGLLLAALLLETFIVTKNRREVEPAVLWLLFWSICAFGVMAVVMVGMFFFGGRTRGGATGFGRVREIEGTGWRGGKDMSALDTWMLQPTARSEVSWPEGHFTFRR